MIKVFTIDDVVEVPLREHMTGVVDTIWCHVLFKGCSKPVEFVAWKQARNDFSKAMLEKLQAGEFGELAHGNDGWISRAVYCSGANRSRICAKARRGLAT